MPLPLSLFAEGVSWKYLNLADDISLIEMLSNIDYFKSKTVNIPKITIWLGNGYHPKKTYRSSKNLSWGSDKIWLKLSPKQSLGEKKQERKTGFVPVKTRCFIERTNSWMGRCKSLTKNLWKNSPKMPMPRLIFVLFDWRLRGWSYQRKVVAAISSYNFLEIPVEVL